MKSCKSEDSVAKVKVKEEDKKLIRNQVSAQNMLAIARDVSLKPRTSNHVSDKQRRLDWQVTEVMLTFPRIPRPWGVITARVQARSCDNVFGGKPYLHRYRIDQLLLAYIRCQHGISLIMVWIIKQPVSTTLHTFSFHWVCFVLTIVHFSVKEKSSVGSLQEYWDPCC